VQKAGADVRSGSKITVPVLRATDRVGWIPDLRRDPLRREGSSESSHFGRIGRRENQAFGIPIASSASRLVFAARQPYWRETGFAMIDRSGAS
jgi:hypothetical protein